MSAWQFRSFPLGLLLALCLLLVGCMDIQIRLVVHPDGSGIVTWNFEIPPETAALGITSARLKAELLKDKNFIRPEAQIREGRAPNGNQTLMATVPVQDVSQISSSDFRVAFARLPDGKKCSFNVTGNNDPLKAATARIRMDVEMPGKIISSNADQVTGNVAHFTTVFRPEALYVEAETSRFAFGDIQIIAVSGALAVLASTVVWALRRGREKQLAQVAGAPGGRGVGSGAGTPAVEPAFVYCGECGTQNRSSSRFCRRCGGGL
jgi:hypothetical protein